MQESKDLIIDHTKDYEWGELPRIFRDKANEIYLSTGLDLGILHDVAYRIEQDAKLRKQNEEIHSALQGLVKLIGRR